MQKAILLHLFNGGTVTIGADHFILADKPSGSECTTVQFETMTDDGTIDVLESPKDIQKLLNELN